LMDQQRDAQHNSYRQRDALNIQKKMLDLQLASQELNAVQSPMGGPEAPPSDASAGVPPPAPDAMPKAASDGYWGDVGATALGGGLIGGGLGAGLGAAGGGLIGSVPEFQAQGIRPLSGAVTGGLLGGAASGIGTGLEAGLGAMAGQGANSTGGAALRGAIPPAILSALLAGASSHNLGSMAYHGLASGATGALGGMYAHHRRTERE
jgi:hypothetical protein